MSSSAVSKQDLGVILIAAAINKSLKKHADDSENSKITIPIGGFLRELQSLTLGYTNRFTPNKNEQGISKHDLISTINSSKFSNFVEISNDRLVILAKPREYEETMKKIVLESAIRHSQSLIKQINDIGEEYRHKKTLGNVQPLQMTQAPQLDQKLREVEKDEAEDVVDEEKEEDEEEDEESKSEADKEDNEQSVTSPKLASDNELDVDVKDIESASNDKLVNESENANGKFEVKSDSQDNTIVARPEEESESLEEIAEVAQQAENIDELEQNEVPEVSDEPEIADSDDDEILEAPEVEEPAEDQDRSNEQAVSTHAKNVTHGESSGEKESMAVENDVVIEKLEHDSEVTAVKEEEVVSDAAATPKGLKSSGSTPEPTSARKRSGSPNTSSSGQRKRFQNIAVNLINSIQAHRYSSPFLQAVNKRDAHDYYDVIYEPKNLKGILKNIKLKAEPPEYQLVKQLERDIMLMFANCVMYNKSDEDLVKLTISMKNDVTNIFKMFEEAELDIK
ncbi:uncharacterized protein CANTADRAFT_53715 [Suhomyces tanzawaensis NRRL Y-17324]|uniref:Bromo domain-containing protein n=1 Tax=Suhomyces tanzawaensis NRRL Y-17324 TaxID=984487 RepID=A0A1E4SFS7_9ASCO|nr:uncharacterized protein CANTADRAFT_53715 [Suhomyces tanzawaensis NRRL Y-17324]ODV78315.1 hypothetical protein CANTADRAFT_53715 [Suhomyces tanzawaensis NRRL Y-17324]